MSTPPSTPLSAPEIVVQQYETDNEPSPRSSLLKNRSSANTRPQSYTESPKSRFQFAAKRVININRLSSLTQRIQINNDVTNNSLPSFLARKRPPWSKIRWINVDGLSWDVIKPLAMHYDLHPLAVEDLFHIPQRTKVDYYTNHIFISLILHTFKPDNENTPLSVAMADPLVEPPPLFSQLPSSAPNQGYTNSKYYKAMKKFRKNGVHVALEQTFLFMVNEENHANTLITFFQHSGRPVTVPVEQRLRLPKTLLRSSMDVSLLMQCVLDAIVDHTLPIADSYRQQIAELEEKILIGPQMSYTRGSNILNCDLTLSTLFISFHFISFFCVYKFPFIASDLWETLPIFLELHLITGELTLLKRTLAPIQNLIHTLHDHDHDESNPVSLLARTYFGDVLDHCTTTVENLDMMIAVSDNLINMVFNTIAYETNESMRKLSIISIVFLPITFLAGVYGMNFKNFPALEQDVVYFWKICACVLAAMIVIFTASYWERLFNQAWQRMRRWIWWKEYTVNGDERRHEQRRGLMRKWGKGVMARS
ncbi:hypothetical protein BC937DRAFT_89993 [Endogone sp. FLAS-F59071]|nr:hypothetical protein BC937DRAFT_89993 [Endogone sp. FLAS-F59071]|eukprot:RUS17421.1 hypothetical protein BC937DRAFT_89993 [Endogone sp. FLAS-F59071]